LRSNSHFEVTAAPGDSSFILKAQLQAAKRDFEPGRIFIISNEQVRYAQRKRIECAAGGNTELSKAGAPQILD
jgi:hypothetical protein